jgi:hypothetical protein
MAKFTIRVELHNATWQNYADLAKNLAARGIVDVIRADDGTWYKMPPAEYNYEGNATRDQVLETTKTCTAAVVRSFAVMVTEANGRAWHGLAVVQNAKSATR